MANKKRKNSVPLPVTKQAIRRVGKRESRRLGFLMYEAMYGPIVLVKAVYRQLIILLAMFIWGTAIFTFYDRLPILDAFLASVSTITTIGLYVPNGGNFQTLNRTEAELLIIMILVSVGVAVSILQSTVNAVLGGDLAKEQAEKKLIGRLRGHVIVFGYSHVGKYVTEKLEELGMDHVVITKDPQVYHDLVKRDIYVVLEQEIQPIQALREAGIENASIVVVSHINDPDNMLFILSARKLRPDIRIITIVHDPAIVETAKNAGADLVVPSTVTVGHLLALSAVTKDIVGIVFSEKVGTREIAQFSVFKGSPLIGKKLSEVAERASVIAIVRSDQLIRNIFDPSLRISEDDTLLLFGDPADLLSLEEEAKAV